jgi:hypothetical protein
LDDFSSITPKGTGTAAYNSRPYLLADVNNPQAEEKAGTTPDSALYKFATGTYDLKTYQLGFEMALVAHSLPLSQLRLGIRGDDAWNVYEVPFTDLVDPDGEPMPKFDGTWQNFVIDLTNSISDDTVQYTLKGTATPSGTRVLDQIVGFHLMCSDATYAKIGIAKVYIVKGAEVTVIDDFEHAAPGDSNPNLYWRGSIGSIVKRCAILEGTENYAVSDPANADGYANIVASMRGDFSGLSVTAIKADGTPGPTVAYQNLQDAEGNALPATMTTYRNLIINYANSGLGDDVAGLSFATAGPKVWINNLFFTNLISREAVKQYPYLDTGNVTVFDDYGWTKASFNGDYASSSTDPIITGAGLYYALSYNNGTMVQTIDGNLVFDATSLAANDWISFKEASTRANSGYKYLVLSIKATDGATLDGFRVGGSGAPVWGPTWYSAFGLKVATPGDASYPYTNAAGYSYIIIDMAESGLAVADTLDMYYSGVGKLFIDKVFFANEASPEPDTANPLAIVTESTSVAISDSTYQYVWGGSLAAAHPYIGIVFKGDGTVDLSSFRLAIGNSPAEWLKDGALIGPDGLAITPELTTDPRTIIIDLAASGLEGFTGDIHIHLGALAGIAAGTVTVVSTAAYDTLRYTRWVNTDPATIAVSGSYVYGGWVNPANPGRYLALQLHGDGTVQLANFRMEASGKTIWANGSLVDINGVKLADIVIGTETQIIYVDLIASGFDINAMAAGNSIHLHFGGDGPAGTLTIEKAGFMDLTAHSYGEIMTLI